MPKQGDILISAVGTIGISWVVPDDRKFYFKDGNLIWLKQSNRINSLFLKFMLDIFVQSKKEILTNGVAYNALTIVKLKQIKIPLPTLEMQETIVSSINEEIKLVKQNKQLIEIFEQKINNKISEVWGE